MMLISIVISLYNSRDTIKYCLDSVVKQTYSNIEIILVDDGSDEKYDDIIKSQEDERITFYKLRHTNANVARNFGIKKSKGKYIAMLDADDMWLPNHLEDCISTIIDKSADGLYGSLIIRNSWDGNERKSIVRALYEGETMIDYLLRTGYGAQTSTLFLSSESAKTIKWDESLDRHQDYDFVVRYCQLYKMVPKTEATVVYVVNKNFKNIDFDSCIKVIEKFKNDISPYLYNLYHQSMLKTAQYCNASRAILKHYKKESVRNLEYISYTEYLLICNPKNRFEQFRLKIKYLFYLVSCQFEYV